MSKPQTSLSGQAKAQQRAEDLLELVTVEAQGSDIFRACVNDANIEGEIFGGQYLGQALSSAQATAPDYQPQMIAGFFLRAARADEELTFSVVRTRNGRNFAHRSVSASQAGNEVFRAEIALGKSLPDGPEHGNSMPSVPPVDQLRSLRQLALDHSAEIGPEALARLTSKLAWEVYPLEPQAGFGEPARRPAGRFWVVPNVDPNQLVSQSDQFATLAYLSDVMANWPSRATHAGNAYDGSLTALSLNHCIWFHERPNGVKKFLFDLESQRCGAGIGSNRGLIYGDDRRLVASVAQNALVRFSGRMPHV